jgi:phosphatidate phosphatase APP1
MSRSLLAVMKRRSRPVTDLDHEDRVVLFPSLGHLSPGGGEWIVSVHGDVFAAGKVSLGKRVLLKLLQRAMRAPQEAFATPLFQERIARFLAIDRPGRRVAVQIGDEIHALPKRTRRNGHFVAALRIASERAMSLGAQNGAALGCLPFQVCGTAAPLAAGQAYLLPARGLSVISDIDDTLKHSFVGCKRTLLANTFLRPFETIPGMAAVFRDWAAGGAAFHYVSSSPWQLYEHLAAHLAGEGFPHGSFHLRSFRLRDQLLRRVMLTRRSGKANVIRSILRTFPERRFLLVGDSGELDPEIYGYMGRKFPQQVAGICIRQLGGVCDTRERFEKAFRGLSPSLVRLYRSAEDLADVPLPGR